ncbi:MAG: hypothetical protein ACI8XG_000345 [Congregibacter sp.]|jgi:hypothetical protein
MTDPQLQLEVVKIKGIKARSAAAVKTYIETLIEAMKSRSLLGAVSDYIRLAVPEDYKQLSLNNPIKAALQKLGHVKPGSTILPVSTPLDVVNPGDIQSFNEGRYNTTVIELTVDLNVKEVVVSAGDHLKVLKVERQNSIIHFVSLVSGKKYEFDLLSVAFQKAAKKALFYYESVINLSEGDIVYQLKNPTLLTQVESITDKDIILKDINARTTVLERGGIDSRLISLGYAANGATALQFTSAISIVIIDGDEGTKHVKNFVKHIKANTREYVFIYGVEKTLRKSIQVVCPADMMSSIDQAVSDSKLGYKGYVEALIDDLIHAKLAAEENNGSYMVLYSSPPFSKAHAFWISETHYDKLKGFCDDAGLKVNPMAHHLIIRDLKKRGLIEFNDLLM